MQVATQPTASEFRGGIICDTLRPVSGADFVSTITDGYLIHSLFLVSQARRSPHIRIPLTIHATLFSASQPRSPHIHSLQSKYIQSHSRVPTGVDLPTYTPPQLTIHTASFSCPRRSPHIRIPLRFSSSPCTARGDWALHPEDLSQTTVYPTQ